MKNERLYDGVLVKTEHIERAFGSGERKVRVLRGVDLEVEAGQLVALYGPSGSGKTTLLNLIGALDRPTAGTVHLTGENITRMGNRRRARIRRRKLGMIFQNNALMPTYTAAENVDLALRLPGLGYLERRRRVRTALDAVGLGAWASHMPDQMSGGQRQRVAIARALALRPAVILADEPTSGLDTRTSRRVLALFQGIARIQGTAFVIVSHDPLVAEFVDAAYDLHEGKLIARTANALHTAYMPPDALHAQTPDDDAMTEHADLPETLI